MVGLWVARMADAKVEGWELMMAAMLADWMVLSMVAMLV